MPQVSHTITVAAIRADVWRFVREIDNWAADVPGYQEHTVLDAERSRWVVRGDLGVVSRVMETEVVVTAWCEPDEVRFDVRGLNESVQGQGRFVTAERSAFETDLGFHLDLQAGGKMGPLVNALLQPILPKLASAFAANLARHFPASPAAPP